MSNNDKKLTPRRRRFAECYCASLNATQAAKEAGYSERTANEQGARLLANVSVKAEIERLKKERSERTKIDADRVLLELARIGLFDVRKAFNPDGTMKRLDELDDDTAAAIAGLEVVTLSDSEGFPIGTLKKVKIADKIAALKTVAQHLGMLDPKLTIKGDAENPLTLLIKSIQGNSLKPVRESVWGGDEPEDDA